MADTETTAKDIAALASEVKGLRYMNIGERLAKLEVRVEKLDSDSTHLFQKGDKRDEADKIFRSEVASHSQTIEGLSEGLNKKASNTEVDDLRVYVKWLLGGLVGSVLLWIIKFGFQA